MIEVKLDNGTSVVLYSSIKELPITVSKEFSRHLLQDMGIGYTIESVDEHLAKAFQFVAADKKADAMEELKNLRYNLFFMQNHWDCKALSFGCLVKSVNGTPITDYSNEIIAAMLADLSALGLTNEKVQDTLDNVKKNWRPNETSTFQNSLRPT